MDLYRYRLADARRHFEIALARNPASAEAMVGIGRALIDRRALDLAEKQLRQALAVGGDRADAWGALAQVALEQSDGTGRPWRFADRALELDPDDAMGNYVIAEYYRRRENDFIAMLYYYRRSPQREPYFIPINRLLVRAGTSPAQLLADDTVPTPPPRN